MSALISSLATLDTQALYAINHGMSNALFDSIMPWITSSKMWLPVYVIGLAIILVQGVKSWDSGGRSLVTCVVLIVLGTVLLDKLSAVFLKEVIARPRPYMVLPDIHQLVGSGGGSFPSNHAMNNAFMAYVLSAWFWRRRYLWWSLALTIAFSRLYCGVHYPSDVLGGLLIGITMGWVAIRVLQYQWPQLLTVQPPRA